MLSDDWMFSNSTLIVVVVLYCLQIDRCADSVGTNSKVSLCITMVFDSPPRHAIGTYGLLFDDYDRLASLVRLSSCQKKYWSVALSVDCYHLVGLRFFDTDTFFSSVGDGEHWPRVFGRDGADGDAWVLDQRRSKNIAKVSAHHLWMMTTTTMIWWNQMMLPLKIALPDSEYFLKRTTTHFLMIPVDDHFVLCLFTSVCVCLCTNPSSYSSSLVAGEFCCEQPRATTLPTQNNACAWSRGSRFRRPQRPKLMWGNIFKLLQEKWFGCLNWLRLVSMSSRYRN